MATAILLNHDMKKSLLFILLAFSMQAKSQNVGIGTLTPTARLEVNNGNTPGALKIVDGTQGEGKVLTSNADGLASWSNISGQNTGWSINGNAGITAVNFIGTIDGQALRFKVNNRPSGIIDSALANTSIGFKSLYSNTTGPFNTAYGARSLFSNTTGSSNTASGTNSLYLNSSGNENTANGFQALFYNTTGSRNTANGAATLFSNSTGSDNTANGSNALKYNTTGLGNSAIGSSALYVNSTGVYNTAAGHFALISNTTGNANTANGAYALDNNIGANNNTATGTYALHFNTHGAANAAHGYLALSNNIDGNNNTALGSQSLGNINVGSNNTGVGYNANPPSAISNNQVRIGDNNISYAGIQVAWTITSDARWKEQVRTIPMGLNLISRLRPVDYIRTTSKEFPNGFNAGTREAGFIAQEVNETLKELGYNNSGMITRDDNGYYGMRYNDLTPVLVKAMQEQQAQIKQLQSQNESLQIVIQNLLKRLENLEVLQKK